MKIINNNILNRAKTEAIYNMFLYLPYNHKTKSLKEIASRLELLYERHPKKWQKRDIQRLQILKEAIKINEYVERSEILEYISTKNGLTACVFIKPDNNISFVFKGTGCGEWIDNGEGLSGIPEENTYLIYDTNSSPKEKIVSGDYATDQQTEALNWYCKAIHKHHLQNREITVSGHSKGGNKAQFITMKRQEIKYCFNFNGQGFSPEALTALENDLKEEYTNRASKIYGFCSDNDYVHVLGAQLVRIDNQYYFKSKNGIHLIEAMIDSKGDFNPQCNQGYLSKYVESISDDMMSLPPHTRKYATLGIMNIFQKHLGKCEAVNNDAVSTNKTIAGLGITAGVFLNNLRKSKTDKFKV